MPGREKSASAFRTIGEVADELALPQHRLRFWETRFPQLRPLQRGGQRRYYRVEDVALVRRIDQLLNREGYTIQGVQRLLAIEAKGSERLASSPMNKPDDLAVITGIRDLLKAALAADRG